MIINKSIYLRAVDESDLLILKNWRNNDLFRVNFREHREINNYNQTVWFDSINKSQNNYMFSICDSKTNELIGACGLLYINWIIRSADFSFYIGKNDIYIDNSNISLDSVNALIRYGFKTLNLNKIWMELYEFDEMKINFFTKNLGFSIDGLLRDNVFYNGEYRNSYILSLKKDEWQ